MANRTEFAKMFAALALAWPKYEMQKQTVEVYFRILQDLPDEYLEKASHHLMATSTFFPSISEWRKATIDLMTPQIPTEFEAWEEVMTQIRSIGSYYKPEFSHPLITRTVETMGWRTLCMSEQIEYDRAHFYKAYAALRNRALDEVRMLPEVAEYRRLSSGPKQLADIARDMKIGGGGE